MNSFSPNMIKTFEECPKKFSFKYIKKISMPQRSDYFVKGKKIHALANYYLCGENIEKMERTLNLDEKKLWEDLKSNKYLQLTPIKTEYNLSCKIDKFWIGGRLDAFMTDNQNNYFILDYKTGNIPQNAELDFQTITYLLCADKLLQKKGQYNSLQFIYIGLKKGTEKEIKFTDELKINYENRIASTCNKIDFAISSNLFTCKKESCKTCEYKNICLN